MTTQPLGMWLSSRPGSWAFGFLLLFPVIVLMTALDPRASIGIGPAIGLAAIILRWPITAVIAVIASVPIQQVGAVGPLTATRALVAVAVATTIVFMLTERRPLVLSWILLPFAVLVSWMTVSAAGANNPSLAIDEILRWTIALTVVLIALQSFVGASDRAFVATITVIGIVAALQAAMGILQAFLSIGPASFEVAGRLSRAFGTFGRPNTFAGYLEMALFPVLWLAVYQARITWQDVGRYRVERLSGYAVSAQPRLAAIRSTVLTLALLGCSGVIFTGIVISFSRGAWVGVSLGLLASFAIALRRLWIPVLAFVPIVALVMFSAASSVAPGVVSDRVASIVADSRPFDAASVTITDENFAAVERMAHWQTGWEMFKDHPVAGVGPGNYNSEYTEYFVRAEFRSSQGHAHNFYVHVLAETGLVGLSIYLTLIVSVTGIAFAVARRASGLPQALALGGVGTTVAVSAHNVFENLHVLNLSIQLVATWALVIAAHRRWNRAREQFDFSPGQPT